MLLSWHEEVQVVKTEVLVLCKLGWTYLFPIISQGGCFYILTLFTNMQKIYFYFAFYLHCFYFRKHSKQHFCRRGCDNFLDYRVVVTGVTLLLHCFDYISCGLFYICLINFILCLDFCPAYYSGEDYSVSDARLRQIKTPLTTERKLEAWNVVLIMTKSNKKLVLLTPAP